MKQTLIEIEENINSGKETDRIMWFSMWAILSVASFGIAWFPMVYYMVKRRNDHFARQEKLESLILLKLKNTPRSEKSISISSKTNNKSFSRNALVWTFLTILVVPAFYLFYSLKLDLRKHEEHEHEFLTEIGALIKDLDMDFDIQSFGTTPSFPPRKYVIFSVATFGLAAAYWLYRIFNDYNNHFKMQWMIEDKLLRLLKELDKNTESHFDC